MHRFTPRITKCGSFYIYIGPQPRCPKNIEPWIQQFCKQPENKWYVEIDHEWAADGFNQYGFDEIIPNYDLALNMILDERSKQWAYLTDQNIEGILKQAIHQYGLLHARYITQAEGLVKIKEKYLAGEFGTCPRVLCDNEKLIPIGTSHKIRHHSLKLYCPKCNDIYKCPPDIRIDGAHFGPAFPHIFFQYNQKLDSFSKFRPFVMEMFGFKIHRSALPEFMPHEKNSHERDIVELD